MSRVTSIRITPYIIVCMLCGACLLLFGRSAQAATVLTVTINSDGPSDACDSNCSLRDALAAAVSGDTIVFDPSLAGQTIVLTNGEMMIDKSITIDGSGAPGLTIDGDQTSRIFWIASDMTVLLKALTLSNGADYTGGGIFNEGLLTLDSCSMFGNVTNNVEVDGGDGGAIFNIGLLTITNTQIMSNSTGPGNLSFHIETPNGDGGDGGGIFNMGTLVITNSQIAQNNTGDGSNSESPDNPPGYGGDGGGIYNAGVLTMTNSQVDNNWLGFGGSESCSGRDPATASRADAVACATKTMPKSKADLSELARTPRDVLSRSDGGFLDLGIGFGAGIYNAGELHLFTSEIYENGPATDGGGIYNAGQLDSNQTQVANNLAVDLGGGLFNSTEGLTIRNTDFLTNAGFGLGGGLFSIVPITIESSQFIDNYAFLGGGLFANLDLTLTESTFLSNTAEIAGGGLMFASTVGGNLTGNTFHFNQAGSEGGALDIIADDILLGPPGRSRTTSVAGKAAGFVAEPTPVLLTHNSIMENSAGEVAGALAMSGVDVTLINNMIAANQGGVGAAEIAICGCDDGTDMVVHLRGMHNTFASATPGEGAAIVAGDYTISDTIALTNTIFADYAIGIATGPNPAFVTLAQVLWSNVMTPTVSDAGGVTVTNAYVGDALFVDAGQRNYHLTQLSAAVNRGAEVGVTDDFDGDARPQQIIPDLGADEVFFALPALLIDNASSAEGDLGLTNQVFTVTLSELSPLTITVNYSTVDGTATAGSDYVATSGTLTFAPFQTRQLIVVAVQGDVVVESDEYFTLEASSSQATGATATGAIIDDDATRLSISDASGNEGNSGVSNVSFTVALSKPSLLPVTVNYQSSDGTATTADDDYAASSGMLTFAPLQTNQTINVPVFGDLAFEADENFMLTLSNAEGAVLAKASGVATLVNDDTPLTLVLSKTVGIQNIRPVCTNVTQIKVPIGTTVVYCFTLRNQSAYTPNRHTLVDDHLGRLLDDAAFDLAPNASFIVSQTATLTASVTNIATWTATIMPTDETGDSLAAASLDSIARGLTSTQAVVTMSAADDDQDGDTIPDNVEAASDVDHDNVPNFLDLDSDDDGLSDINEAGPDPYHPLDSNNDGVPDFLSRNPPTSLDETSEPAAIRLYLPLVER